MTPTHFARLHLILTTTHLANPCVQTDDESEYTDDTDPWDPDLDEAFALEGCLNQFVQLVDHDNMCMKTGKR